MRGSSLFQDDDAAASRMADVQPFTQVGILSAIRHPNVVLFMGVCLEPPCLVTEVSTHAFLAGSPCRPI